MLKYQVISNEIRKRITTGQYQPKTMIPDQKQLAAEFGVSMITIKKALDGLAREGLIYKKSGLGTFVLGKIPLGDKYDSPANAFDGLSSQQGKGQISTEVIKFAPVFPSLVVAEKLDCTVSDTVYEIVRLRRLNGAPFILEHTFMPVRLVKNLTEDVIKKSIYQYMHKQLHLKFGGAYRKIHAAIATPYDIKYLGADKQTPMLEVEQVVWLENGDNVEYSKSRNLYNRRSYTVIDVNDF
ncbi:GntR family transcriptional regulator [Lacticaseibacillus paracasei]|uniref:GntR family transcriptional regulator n=1 Tax=Lacticaseibacillus paracasei TaxID=1597 RepID=UPI00339393B9